MSAENKKIIQELQKEIERIEKENENMRRAKKLIKSRLEGIQNPVLPKKGEKNIMITSALPYVNNVPHLGNIIGAVLSADVYARYCRQRGYNTLYICGTDEYGTATETKALKEGLTPQEICDKYHKIHKEIYEWFNISFDLFGRTSTPKQTEIAQEIFLDIEKRGLTSVKTTSQLYSEAIGKFLADRFVHGTCPHCAYEDARGDQCDRCGKLLKPTDLIDPKCSVSKTTPVLKDSTHIYLDLPKMEKELDQWARKSMAEGTWSNVAQAITEAWLKEGLLERCITRDLKWGTPVPNEKFKDKVFYVWFDAPIGYISITANYTSEWKQWWRDTDDVDYVQFMGKDNVPFHSVIFPSTLMATGKKWTKVSSLSSTAYLNYEDTKFSKSRGTGIFGDQARDTGIPAFSWRYYLISTRPTASDSSFEWTAFSQKINTELLANLGNFTNRALRLCSASFGGLIPESSGFTDAEQELFKETNSYLERYIAAFDKIRLKEALQLAMLISKEGNRYLQQEKPWVLIKEDKARCGTVIHTACQLVYYLAVLMEPFTPSLSEIIYKQLGLPEDAKHQIPTKMTFDYLKGGHKIGKAKPIIKPILEDKAKELRKKFGGEQEEKPVFQLSTKAGKILEVAEHPEADRLYLLQVDVGEEKPRQICGGLRATHTKEQLLGKTVVVACNLKHAKMKGQKSEGMLMASENKKGMQLLSFSDESKIKVGAQVIPEGSKFEPAKVVNRKLLQTILKTLSTDKKGNAVLNKKLVLKVGDVSVQGIPGAKLK